jgi:hypothetical protein
MYRAIRELERIRSEGQKSLTDASVIDVEAVEKDQLEPSKPRLIQS